MARIRRPAIRSRNARRVPSGARGSARRDAIELLRRQDKHYLGAGDGALFDPPQPLWLERPGFWDGGHLFHFRVRPLFTVTFTDPAGRELPLAQRRRTWTPAALVARYRAPGLSLVEHRAVLPGGRFVSEWELTAAEPAELVVVGWTAQEGTAVEERDELAAGPAGARFRVTAPDVQRRAPSLAVDCELGFADAAADGWGVYETQHASAYPNAPIWDASPLRELWADGTLGRAVRTAVAPPERGRTLVHAGVARTLRLEPGRPARLALVLRTTPADPALRWAAPPAPLGVPAARSSDGGVAARSAASLPAARGAPRREARSARTPHAAASRDAWRAFFRTAPALACSDPYLERYFAYRWYGLRLNFIDPAGPYRHPTCAEGVEYFHCPIAYSAWCHARELRWLPDPARARGALLTFFDHQRPDGQIPGRVYLTGQDGTDFYFADWGGALEALDEVHPDRAFLAAAYGPLARFADWLARERDPDGTGLYAVHDPYETGQENMSRYTAVDPDADRMHFDGALRLLGVDLTVYAYRLRRALARAAATLGLPAHEHDAAADRIADAVRRRMWDPELELFSDVDPRDMTRTRVKAAVCFYPYFTDIAGREHLAGLARHLFDPAAFWLPWPVPSTAADDPRYSPDAEWGGVRQNCAWNGRVWPMTNAHVVEALGRVATELDGSYRERAAELLGRTIRMLFLDGDPARPTCYEHYSPVTGRPALYRGLDDYQHSWINDLIIRYAAGFRPRPGGGFVVDPLPLPFERLTLERLPYRGSLIDVIIDGERVQVRVDGTPRGEARRGEPLEVRA